MNTETKVYRQNNLTFFVDDEKIVVQTSLPQTFYLEPRAHYWRRRERLIATMISIGEIRSLQELAQWCGHGVAWVNTNQKYEVDNLEKVC